MPHLPLSALVGTIIHPKGGRVGSSVTWYLAQLSLSLQIPVASVPEHLVLLLMAASFHFAKLYR
jgi:hypothetical protein